MLVKAQPTPKQKGWVSVSKLMAKENEMDLGLALGTPSSSNQQQVELESSGAGAVQVQCAAGCCLLSPSQHEKYENDGEMKCVHFIEMEKESMASLPVGDVAGPSEVGPLHNRRTADLLPLLASEPHVLLKSKTENIGDGLGLDIGLPLKIQEPPQIEREEDESGSASAPSPEKMEETAENDVLIAKDANLEKDLVPEEIESKMREEPYQECNNRDEDDDDEEEEDKSHGSMESCNSANLLSKKRWRFEQQLIIGSKRIKKQSQECLFSTPVVKQDSSFMNWISNMVKGIKPSQQEPPHSLALSIDHHHHHHSVDDDHKINSVGKKLGFQTVFQSLYSQDAKRVETKNKSVGGSKEIVLFDSNNDPDDILNQKPFGNLWIARFSPKTPATLLSSSTDDASASVGLKQLEEPVAETLKASTCLFCGKRGHELRDCLQINEKEVEGLLKNVRLYKGVSKEVSCLCIKCFQLNHWASACPSKRSSKIKEGRADLKLNEIPKHPGGKMPKEMFDTIRRLRLSRTDILKWMNSRLPISSLDGYFVRLRLAKWEEGVGGAGYYVGRVTGSKKPICVDIGGVECLVESRYISNCDFLEDELIGWWRTMLTSRRRLP
ncbi:hypothetical protein OSB04_029807 [Centaurea solstitialis]|uniref:CCHC-type domain-containing protein n=1 Tax=Centaurea solstitialis TaxID=347529 RepID=A0AA38S5M5_9ASTR|nr:hypothetical protein OSB04_029807 [Centaurea solstitialis]